MKEREETIEKESIKKQEKEPGVLEYLQKELPPHAEPPYLEGHIVNNMPIYGIDNGATIDGILNRIEGEQPESWSDYVPFQYGEKGVERSEARKLEVDEFEGKTYNPHSFSNNYDRLPCLQEDTKPTPLLYEIEQQRKRVTQD